MNAITLSSEINKTEHILESSHLERSVAFDIFIPRNLLGNEELNLLLLNDGQDADALKIEQTLAELYGKGKTAAIVVVAIKASKDRINEYGVANHPDFLGRGAKAAKYNQFIVTELLPVLPDLIEFPINGKRAFAGFSLGGLSAFDVAWNNDHVFDLVGVMSGSFWWRNKDLKSDYNDDTDRIMHQVIRSKPIKPKLKFWLMAGTNDEVADRNKNFIIDSIDDTVDIIKELLKKDYNRPQDIFYYEMVGGEHNVQTWAKALSAFLIWAFPVKRI
jgi:enterochelin esterase-like enzyme